MKLVVYRRILSALVLAFFVVASIPNIKANITQDARQPVEITKEEAAKKYPDQKGNYAQGTDTVTDPTDTHGFIKSPYSSRVYDCRKIKHGALLVDEGAKKVFVRP